VMHQTVASLIGNSIGVIYDHNIVTKQTTGIQKWPGFIKIMS